MPEIKKMGFVSIVNLRESTEVGAEVEKEEAVAKAAGLRYYHVPFNGGAPDPKAADQFLSAISSKGAEPAFIHCSGGNRAATMWLIKRLVVDHWDVKRAPRKRLRLARPALRCGNSRSITRSRTRGNRSCCRPRFESPGRILNRRGAFL